MAGRQSSTRAVKFHKFAAWGIRRAWPERGALLTARAERLLVEKQIVTSPLAPQRMTLAIARESRFEAPRESTGRVTFVRAGLDDPDLLTLKAHRLLGQADVVVYAGSLVPEEVVRRA